MKRAVLLGNKDLAVGALDVLTRYTEVVGVVLNHNDDGAEGRWYQSLRRAAEGRGIVTAQPNSINDPEGVAFLRRLAPDIMLSCSYSRILCRPALACAGLAMNIHFSALPRHRGCLPVVWAIAEGDSQVGVTLHVMDTGIDSGDIIAQVLLPVDDEDTAYTVYFRCVRAGLALLDCALPSILDGSAPRRPQDLAAGSYHTQEYPSDRWITAGMTDREARALTRALTFPGYPGARTKK